MAKTKAGGLYGNIWSEKSQKIREESEMGWGWGQERLKETGQGPLELEVPEISCADETSVSLSPPCKTESHLNGRLNIMPNMPVSYSSHSPLTSL